MIKMNKKFVEKHQEYYATVRTIQNSGRIISPGEQYIIHLLKGGYLGQEYTEVKGRKALDVGCGSGFNLVSLALMGWQAYGIEITEDIVEKAAKNVESYGSKAEITVGENENIPYPEDTFDLLLSMNVIHYVQSREAVSRTVKEYARVLKSGGRFFLSTQHPDNWLVKDAETVGVGMVKVRFPGDYRDGQVLFQFCDQNELQDVFKPYFDHIMLGENRFDFFTRVLRHFIITGVKK
jgi:SAM-dependent methyltransferase